MRLAEEEKLRKEMSAKKAKEEAERKHQVSWECPGPPVSIHWLSSPHPTPAAHPLSTQPPFIRALGSWSRARTEDRGLWLQSERVHAHRSTFSTWSRGERTQYGATSHMWLLST